MYGISNYFTRATIDNSAPRGKKLCEIAQDSARVYQLLTLAEQSTVRHKNTARYVNDMRTHATRSDFTGVVLGVAINLNLSDISEESSVSSANSHSSTHSSESNLSEKVLLDPDLQKCSEFSAMLNQALPRSVSSDSSTTTIYYDCQNSSQGSENKSGSQPNSASDPILQEIAEISEMIVRGVAHSVSTILSSTSADSATISEKLTAFEKLTIPIALQEKALKLVNHELKQLVNQYGQAHGNNITLGEYAKKISNINLGIAVIQAEIRNIPGYKKDAIYWSALKQTNSILIKLDLSAKKLAAMAVSTMSKVAVNLLKKQVSQSEPAKQTGFAWLKKIKPQNNAQRLHNVKKQLIGLSELKEQRNQLILDDIKNGKLSFSDLISNGSNNPVDQRKSNEATVYGQTKQQHIIRTRLNVFSEEGWGIDAGLRGDKASIQTQHIAKKYRAQFLRTEKALSRFTTHKTNNPTTSIAQLLTEAVLNTKANGSDSDNICALNDGGEASICFIDASNTLNSLQKLFYFTDGLVRR